MTMDIGYEFFKPEFFKGPGCEGLRIILRKEKTGRHFDPVKVSLRLCGYDNTSKRMTLTFPWRGLGILRACVGKVIIEDWRQKKVFTYTLGGKLETLTNEELTELRLSSPVPILPMQRPGDGAYILASAFQLELARVRARYRDVAKFERKLISYGPEVLYPACLVTVKERCLNHPAHMQSTRLHRIVSNAVNALKFRGGWPERPLSLNDLFAEPERRKSA